MAVHIPAKRVTGPLNDEARARLRGQEPGHPAGYASSGSDHGGATCLSGLVDAFFLETDAGGGGEFCSHTADLANGCRSDRDEGHKDGGGESPAEDRDLAAVEAVRELISPRQAEDPFRFRLAADVAQAAVAFSWLRAGCGGELSPFQRAVMARLRAAWYNAGICKAQWEAAGGLAAGSHEYVDVVAGDGRRYIVELEFAAGFEVARPTESYRGVLAALPRVAVAGEEAMRRAVLAVANAARRSLRSQGLHVPPWRKSRYMLSKWLGPYRRTTNLVPSSSIPAVAGGGDVKCRAVGFPAAAARTRTFNTRTKKTREFPDCAGREEQFDTRRAIM